VPLSTARGSELRSGQGSDTIQVVSALDSGTEQLLVDVDGRIAIVTFNRPEKHNALSREMREALPGMLERLQADAQVRAVVVTGAGDRAFMSGADISELAEVGAALAPASSNASSRVVIDPWASLEKPVLAMIQGYCLGAGVLIALAADIRIASVDSQFGIPAARLGAGYPFGGVDRLVSVVGPAHAADILFSGRRLRADEAVRMGLVNRLVSADDLRSVTLERARAIADNAPLSIAAAKYAISRTRAGTDPNDDGRMDRMVQACFASDDFKEGTAAFGEKRPPRFTGR
jgi:enoyl-CoA hydratase